MYSVCHDDGSYIQFFNLRITQYVKNLGLHIKERQKTVRLITFMICKQKIYGLETTFFVKSTDYHPSFPGTWI